MKFCVIGLGRFGFEVATGLAEHGMEVLAIDSNETIVAQIRDYVTHAVCMRVADETSLRSIGVDEMDTVIVATGENFAQSILITALLKKRLNIPKVIARGINDIHQEILKLVGADKIILPEREIGIRLADTLSSPFSDMVRLAPTFFISQFIAPNKFIGKKIGDLNLLKEYNISCIGIKKDATTIIHALPDYVIMEQDRLVLTGDEEDLAKAAKDNK